jgi:4-methyl-5(b-hydroxyethyl)-thiazole monophosphate biosynthesis
VVFTVKALTKPTARKFIILPEKYIKMGGYIATMCVGILPIADAGLLKGKKATTYPYSQNHENIKRLKEGGAIATQKKVVIDDRIISCDGSGSSLDVAFLLMECLMGPKTTLKES